MISNPTRQRQTSLARKWRPMNNTVLIVLSLAACVSLFVPMVAVDLQIPIVVAIAIPLILWGGLLYAIVQSNSGVADEASLATAPEASGTTTGNVTASEGAETGAAPESQAADETSLAGSGSTGGGEG